MLNSDKNLKVYISEIDRITGTTNWESTIGGLSSWELTEDEIEKIKAGKIVKCYSPNRRRVIDISKNRISSNKEFKMKTSDLNRMAKNIISKYPEMWQSVRSGKGEMFVYIPVPEDVGVVKSSVIEASVVGFPGTYGILEVEFKSGRVEAYSGFLGVGTFLRELQRISLDDDAGKKMMAQYEEMCKDAKERMKELKQKEPIKTSSIKMDRKFIASELIKIAQEMTAEDKYWTGLVPAHDDFGDKITNGFIDGKTSSGQWGLMSLKSFRENGVRLGLGFGQQYEKQADGKWKKTKG